MFVHLLPQGVLEILPFAALLAFGFLMVRAVRRRWAVAPTQVDAPVPDLITEVRVTATIQRLYRDPDQGLWQAAVTVGRRKLTFCAVDYASNSARYAAALGKTADIALYSLGTLAPGGVEAMRSQIADLENAAAVPDLVRLVQAGTYPNDHAVIGRVVSHRSDVIHGEPVVVYRTQVERQSDLTLFIDVAVEPAADAPPFPDNAMVHGSARLFGYLGASSPPVRT